MVWLGTGTELLVWGEVKIMFWGRIQVTAAKSPDISFKIAVFDDPKSTSPPLPVSSRTSRR